MSQRNAPGEKERLIDDKKQQNYDSTSDELDEKEKDNGSKLMIAFFLMLFFQLGNRIFGRLETFPMHNYPMFMNMLSVIIYIPLSFAYIIPAMKYTKNITKEQTEIPKYKFAIMGMWDSIAGIMQTFAVNYISNSSMIVLVQQSAIPISMLISKLTLGAKYTKAQYLGAGVVLLGIILVLIPNFINSASSSPEASESNSSSELIWIFILVISCVPMCLSSVYKEKALGETDIDVIYLNGWVAIFQFLIAIPLCFPSASAIHMPFSELWPNMIGGMKCWMGVNSLPSDDCAASPLFVTTYLAFNVIYNILIIVILKHGSANILWMASTVIVPLSNVAFSLKFMPGSKPLTFWDLLGLVVIMFGLILYRFMTPLMTSWNRLVRKLMRAMSAGATDAFEEEEDQQAMELKRTALRVGKKAESKQTKFIGLNQIEGLQSLIDTRVMREQKRALFRSPQQIRSSLLIRLGIPPSPMISMRPIGGAGSQLGAGSPSPYLSPIRSNRLNEGGRAGGGGGIILQPIPNIAPRISSPVYNTQRNSSINNNNIQMNNGKGNSSSLGSGPIKRAAEV